MRSPVGLTRARTMFAAVGWTTFDQALFSLSNLVITLAVARSGGAEALGRFAVAFAIYLVVLGGARSLISEPLLAQPRGDRDREAERSAATLTLVYGMMAALVVCGLGLVLGRPEILVVAIALPVTLFQDVLRYQAFRRKQPHLAALLDGGWLIGSLAAWPVLIRVPSPAVALLCWAGAALVGTLAGWWFLRPGLAAPRAALHWWRRDTRGLATPLFLDSVLVAISTQAVVFVLAAGVGDDALGLLRAGQVYFQPLLLALVAFGMFLVPRLAQRPDPPTAGFALRLSAGMAAGAAGVCVLILLAEPLLGAVLYDGAIDVPAGLVIPLAAQVVLAAAAGGFAAVAKARRSAASIARSRLWATVIGLVVLAVATYRFGLLGAAWAQVIGAAVYLVGLGLRVTRHDRPTLTNDRRRKEADAGVQGLHRVGG